MDESFMDEIELSDGDRAAGYLAAAVKPPITVELWERWAREVCEDFRISYDNHPVGLRLAITQWMASKL